MGLKFKSRVLLTCHHQGFYPLLHSVLVIKTSQDVEDEVGTHLNTELNDYTI